MIVTVMYGYEVMGLWYVENPKEKKGDEYSEFEGRGFEVSILQK